MNDMSRGDNDSRYARTVPQLDALLQAFEHQQSGVDCSHPQGVQILYEALQLCMHTLILYKFYTCDPQDVGQRPNGHVSSRPTHDDV